MKFARSVIAPATPTSLFNLLGHSESSSNGILLQPSGQEAILIETVPDLTSDTLGGTHFLLDSPGTAYYVWFDVDNLSADPTVAGRTGIEVDISASDTAETVAAALANALNAQADFAADVQGEFVSVTNTTAGDAADAADVDTGFTITKLVEGSSNVFYGSPNGVFFRLEATLLLPSRDTRDIFVSGGGTLIVGLF